MTVPKGRERLSGGPLQKEIIKQARLAGWIVAHFTAVRTEHGWRVPVAADGKGFPDLVLVRDRLIAAEVKGDGDSLRPDQRKWLAALRLAGVEAHVWTPALWLDGTIESVLASRERCEELGDGD